MPQPELWSRELNPCGCVASATYQRLPHFHMHNRCLNAFRAFPLSLLTAKFKTCARPMQDETLN